MKIWEVIKEHAREYPKDPFVIYDQRGREIAEIRWLETHPTAEIFEVRLSYPRAQVVLLQVVSPHIPQKMLWRIREKILRSEAENFLRCMADCNKRILSIKDHLDSLADWREWQIPADLERKAIELGLGDCVRRGLSWLEESLGGMAEYCREMAEYFKRRQFAYGVGKWLDLELQE